MKWSGPEENPCDANDDKSDRAAEMFQQAFGLQRRHDLLHCQKQPMDKTPYYKGPLGTMPESREDEGDEEIEDAAWGCDFVSTEGDVDIIPKPGG